MLREGDRRGTEEHRRKISEALRGKPKTAEHRRNMAEAQRGKRLSKKHKRAIAEGMRRYWAEG